MTVSLKCQVDTSCDTVVLLVGIDGSLKQVLPVDIPFCVMTRGQTLLSLSNCGVVSNANSEASP